MQPTKSNLDEAKRAAPALFAEVGDWFKLYWQDGDATAIDTFQYLGRTRGVAPPGYLTFKLISRSDGPSEVTDGMCEAVGAPNPDYAPTDNTWLGGNTGTIDKTVLCLYPAQCGEFYSVA